MFLYKLIIWNNIKSWSVWYLKWSEFLLVKLMENAIKFENPLHAHMTPKSYDFIFSILENLFKFLTSSKKCKVDRHFNVLLFIILDPVIRYFLLRFKVLRYDFTVIFSIKLLIEIIFGRTIYWDYWVSIDTIFTN